MNERYCPQCGRFKALSAPVCDRCITLTGTKYDDNPDNRYCPKCGKFKYVYDPLCTDCRIQELYDSIEYEESYEYRRATSEYRSKETVKTIPTTKQRAQTKDSFHQKYDSKNIYKCKCGIYVKSKDERTIADFLYENNIPFEYEPKGEYWEYNAQWNKLKVKSIYPDFFIKGPVNFHGTHIENVYIEYWGMNTPDYLDRKAYKLQIYKHYHSTLISVYPEDLYDSEAGLTKKLTHFTNREINY